MFSVLRWCFWGGLAVSIVTSNLVHAEWLSRDVGGIIVLVAAGVWLVSAFSLFGIKVRQWVTK